MNIEKMLFDNQDLKYKHFHSKLIPNINPEKIIGVRIPVLRKMAKQLAKDNKCTVFLNALPHTYYEENNLHAFIIEQISDYDLCIKEVNRFLPYVDNWATCDSLRPKCFAKNTDALLTQINKWLKSNNPYTVRFAIEMLMVYYLGKNFKPDYCNIISRIVSEEYYVNMMISWYFATALAKHWDCAIVYIENKSLPTWVHNKTIQKATESYRISQLKKDYLRTLRAKNN